MWCRCLGRITSGRPQGFFFRKWKEREAPLPFSDGKALGTRFQGGREACEISAHGSKKGTPFFPSRCAPCGHRVFARLHFSFPFPPFPSPPNMSELGLITGKNSRGVKDCPGEGLPLYQAGSPIRSCVQPHLTKIVRNPYQEELMAKGITKTKRQ